MRTECVSVRLDSLVSISEKAYKAIAFDGSEAIIPKSQVFGRDYDVINATSVALSAASGILVPTQSSANQPVARFTLEGKRIPSSTLHKGITVERLSDGTVRKVLSRF